MTKGWRDAVTFVRRACRAAAILSLLGVPIVAAEPPPPARAWHRMVSDETILAELGRMALLASSRVNDTEVAAFLVRRADGRLALERWPDRWERNRQTWRGEISAGAIAIVHTHPDRSPRPSRDDCALARSTGLAVVTLSRWAIWVVEPDGSEPRSLVSHRNWTDRTGWLAVLAPPPDLGGLEKNSDHSEQRASRSARAEEAGSRSPGGDGPAF